MILTWYLFATLISIAGAPFLAMAYLSPRWRWFWFIAAFVVLFIITASVAVAYPENIRHGYPACAACHVAPGGGGATTPYGRDQAALISTWAYEGEQDPLFGLVHPPDWLMLGGDMRYVDVTRRSDAGQSARRNFVMQRDLEVAAHVTHELVVGASAGTYGPDQQPEMRRNYVGLTFFDQFTLRGGRWTPAYGIAFPDHTLPTRLGLGLGEGQETYNTEASYVGAGGEAIITAIYGRATHVFGSTGGGYGVATDSLAGVAGRGAVYVGDRAQAGVSFLNLSNATNYRQAFGIHVLMGFTPSLYAAAEYDKRFEDGATDDIAYGKVGWEVLRGLHLLATGQTIGLERGGGAGLQWFPRPHLELLGEWKRLFIGQRYTDSGLLLFHYYL